MEKTFKNFCILMSALIVILSVMMGCVIVKPSAEPNLDIFGSNDIVENINNMEINMTSVIYVKNAKGVWEEYQRIHGDENRIWVDIENVPQTLIDAVISIEDERFQAHSGVDWKRTFAAALNSFSHYDDSAFGGSTITQQLVKNLTGDNDKTKIRKLREIIRALVIEKRMNKNTILEAYLNTISLGNGICGVQVAANYYFNKDVSELSLLECAALAGITKNPSAYNPVSKPELNKERRQVVLTKMYERKIITREQYDATYDADLKLDSTQRKDFEIPVNSYFVDTLIDNVIANLSKKFGCSEKTASTMLYNGGYKIYATVDPEIQKTMENVYSKINTYFPQKARDRAHRGENVQSSMTVMDYKGHILGIVGGVGEKTVNRGLNRATDSPRQPGSTMKPLGAYAPAIDRGQITYGSFEIDSALPNYYPDGKKGPKEWYGYYAGKMSIQKAIERSANTIPCKIVQNMGLDVSYNFLTQKLHLNHLNPIDKNLSALALGGCNYGITTTESAAAYAIFGNGGKYFEPVTYYKVERANGETVLQCDMVGTQAIKPATASVMNKLLQNVVYGSQGTGRGIASFSKMKAYAKTGTSSESNDLWMVAGSPYYVGSVWYGFDYAEPVRNAGAAASVWKAVMSKIHTGLETKEFTDAKDLIEAKYCRYSGQIAGKHCYSTAKGYFVPGVGDAVCSGKHSGGLGDAGSTKDDDDSSSKKTSSGQTSSTTSSATSSVTSSATSSVTSEPDEPTSSAETPSDSSDVSTPEESTPSGGESSTEPATDE